MPEPTAPPPDPLVEPRPSRAGHSVAVEDYIKQIWKLQRAGERATTKALAERLELGRGTVSGMIKQLAERGLVAHEPYHGATLTDAGERLALRIIRRHRLIELFLVRTLGLGWEEVDRDAERLEHAVSDQLVERIDEVLGHPDVDPHGAPIPTAGGQLESQDFCPLADLPVGATGRVRRVSDRDPAFLKHLRDVGIELEAELTVEQRGPFNQMRIRVNGQNEADLPREATERIQVTVTT